MDKEIATDNETHDNFPKRKQLWKEIINVGNSFWLRSRNNIEIIHRVTVSEISVNSEGRIVSICLGANMFPPEELIKNYEWSHKPPKDNDWESFSFRLTF